MESLLCACLAAGLAPQVQPDWTRRCESGVEWVAPVGNPDEPRLLIQTRDRRIRLLDAATGVELLSEPPRTGPGARPAGALPRGQVAYCFDRYTIYAIRIPSARSGPAVRGRLLWRVGDWPAAEELAGDPEFLTRIVAAHATDEGVLVVRTDGRAALLNRRDAGVRWELRLNPLSDCRIHVHDGQAALLWKSGQNVSATRLDLRTAEPKPVTRRLGEAWPIWSRLTERGVLAVWPNRIVLQRADGAEQITRPPGAKLIRAAAIDLFAAKRELLLFGDEGGGLHAVDPARGTRTWSLPSERVRAGHWIVLKVSDDRFLAVTDGAVVLGDAASGKTTFSHAAADGLRVLDAQPVGERVYALVLENAPLGDGTLFLIRYSRGDAAPARTRLATRARPSDVRVVWLKNRLILVERDALSVYTLR